MNPAARVRAFGTVLFLLPLAAGPAATAQTSVRLGESDPRDARVHAALARVYSDVRFDGVTLRDALERLRGMFGVNMHVEWQAMADYGVTPEREVTLRLRRASGRMLLRLALEEAEPEQVLGYSVRDGVLIVSSAEQPARNMIVRTYSVRDLVMPRQDTADIQNWESEEINTQADRLATVIMETIEPDRWSWTGGGYGTAEWLDGIVTVRAGPETHHQLKGLLTVLRRMKPGESAAILPEHDAFDTESEAARRALDEVLPSVRFDGMPLREALKWIEARYDGGMHVLWPVLKEIGVLPERPVSVRLENVTIAETLRFLLSDHPEPAPPQSGADSPGGRTAERDGAREPVGPCTFHVEEGVLLVATRERVHRRLVTHVYDVKDIITGDEEKGGRLFDIICDTLEPDTWTTNGGAGGAVTLFNDTLVVHNSAAVQVDVRALLASIRQARAAHREQAAAAPVAPSRP